MRANRFLLLVDGMNIAGRSMVTRQIALRFVDVVVHECSDTTPAYEYVNMMREALDNHRNVIIENGWRAEYVLDKLGEPTKIPIPVRRMLDRIALGCGAQVAYCTANTKVLAENVNKSAVASYDEMKPVIDKMVEQWESEVGRLGFPVTRIDTSDVGLILDIDILEDRINFFGSENPGPGIGRWAKGEVVLIVGDRHGPSLQPYQVDANLAFCDMAKVGSSYWLTQKLEEAGIPENRLYWINSYDKNNIATGSEFVQALAPISILALGDSAAGWCEKMKLRYEPFAHPQHHKRFKHREPYPLIERLQELTK